MEGMENNGVETTYFTNEWIIDHNSKILLCDQLAFLFFADTKTMFTEEEHEILNDIAEKMMKNGHEQLESVTVSLTLRYEKLKENDEDSVFLPLFCFKKSSETYFMDHKLKVHDKWVNFENIFGCGYSVSIRSCNVNNNKYNNFICFPCHSYIKQPHLFQIDFALDSGNPPSVEELRECFNDITSRDLNASWKTAKKLVRQLFLQFQINSEFVSNIINNLRTQLNEDVFDALLTGYKEVTGEVREDLGNAYFIKDIQHILHYSNSFERITITIDSQLRIIVGLTLNAKAFVQLNEEERKVILDPDLNNDQFRYTINKYRFYLDQQLVDAEEKICSELGVQKLEDFVLNDVNILRDLKTYQIIRLKNILKNTCLEFNKTFIDLGLELAARLCVNSFEKLDAVMEYAATLLNEKMSEIKKLERIQKNGNRQRNRENRRKPADVGNVQAAPMPIAHNLTRDQLRNQRLERAALEIRENIELLCQTFQDLAAKYIECSQGEKFNFADPMLAATHYKKHGKDYKQEKLTFEKYLQMAREILSSKNMESTWEQEGSVRSFKSEDKQKKIVAIRKDNAIATLYFS